MKKKVLGMTANVDRVIHASSVPCLGCQNETERCVKLYKRAGSNDTMWVELNVYKSV